MSRTAIKSSQLTASKDSPSRATEMPPNTSRQIELKIHSALPRIAESSLDKKLSKLSPVNVSTPPPGESDNTLMLGREGIKSGI
ncbi:hypothetical protein [Candidatus Ichthyocystis sparus]|uniref:hypothetical protein n=1 Tax=Candidatus Ichthyocystis sparus TaxID=1561004 RepID=UPI000B82627B|nr:hypothetical protein [Candidatus Ichthyocystis sparus]